MLLPVSLICSARKVRKDGTSLIFIQYCYSATSKTLLNTGIAIPAKYWQKKHRRVSDELPSNYGKAQALNKELQRLERLSEDIVTYGLENGIDDSVRFLKETFKPSFNIAELDKAKKKLHPEKRKINLDFFHQLEEYIILKARSVTPKMINVYKNMRDTLKAFQTSRGKAITFERIDYNFYEDFMNYMQNEHIHRRRKELITGFKMSTCGKTIKQLRIFLTNRMRKKIISPIDLQEFKIVDEPSDAIYLGEDEIKKIYHTDLSTCSFLEKYRDLFVFGCLTGLRFSDFTTIKKEDVRDNRLFKKQIKSSSWVVIPLREIAKYIFKDKFNGNLPHVSNPDFNYYIKEVGRLAGIREEITFSYKKGGNVIRVMKPKFSWITSHTCRRSFCTNEFLAGTPVELIMKISGHKSIRDFYRYIRITPEEAATQIDNIWKDRDKMESSPLKYGVA
jgi:integrase